MLKQIRNCKKSVPAFSIIETIVGMAVTAIVMAILFLIFTIITERMLDFKNQNQNVNDLNRLTYSLNKDIFEKEKMIKINDELFFKGYAGENATYHFQDNYIIRSNETFIDTFKIKLNQIAIDTVKSRSRQLIFQKIKLEIELDAKTSSLNFYKKVYANELLQKTIQQ